MTGRARVQIQQGDEGPVLRISRPADIVVLILLSPVVWLLAVPAGFLWSLVSAPRWESLLGFLATSVAVGPGVFVWLHNVGGDERLGIGEELRLERRLFGIAWRRCRVRREDVADVAYFAGEFGLAGEVLRRVGLSRGSGAITLRNGRVVRFGSDLGRIWTLDIVALVQTWLNGGAVAVQAAQSRDTGAG